MYKEKVEMAEKMSQDIKNSGNENVDSLFSMMTMFKRKTVNLQGGIEEMTQLQYIKDNDIVGLNEDLASLADYRSNQ